ncbi:DUF4123 domain-containing protein [Mesorhizobium amorphae]
METTAPAFRAALDQMPRPLFAVLDGGQFDDLEDELSDAGIQARALFLRGGDEDMRRDGPWLVALSNSATYAAIEELALEKPCAVFWSCPAGEQALWKHLRSLNEILIPDTRFAGNINMPASATHERVLFRHWDPEGLVPVLRQADLEQFARLLGPAQTILTNAPGNGGLVRVPRPENLPRPSTGPLTLRTEQLEAIDNRSRAEYCSRMSAILREMAPEETSQMSEAQLDELVLRYEASGNKLGLFQERSLSIWGFLMLTTGEKFEKSPDIREFVVNGPGTPDENVETLLDRMVLMATTVEEPR